MVKALHRAGIEVILDVVYNHTAEGGPDGPTISYKGLGNDTYYILEKDRSRYADFTGCANTLNANQSIVRRMILDSLRYWVTEMHVDGFRFDLASILSRDENGHPLPSPPILWDIESDPLLAGTKLIAEAWDAAGLYQVGSFVGDAWQEWNGRFRDDVRSFVRGDNGTVCALASKLVGSPDVYGHKEREVEHSINFVTCHDGFTAERRRLLQREAQRGQRRGQSRRRQRQPELEPRRRGADRRSGDRRPPQPADQEPPRDQSPVRRHAHADDGRRSPPHARREQQRLLPGQRHQLVRLGPARSSPRHASLRPAPQLLPPAPQPGEGIRVGEPHAAPRTGQDPVERRRSRPSRLERPLAHAGRSRWKASAAPSCCTGSSTRTGSRSRSSCRRRRRAITSGGAASTRRWRRPTTSAPSATRRRSAAPATWRSRGRSSCSRWGSTGGRDADRGRGEPDHRRRAQPRLHDRAARRLPRRVADDGRPVRDRRRTRPVSVVPARSAAFPGARRRVPGDGVRRARGSACSSTRRGWPAASSRAAGSVRA